MRAFVRFEASSAIGLRPGVNVADETEPFRFDRGGKWLLEHAGGSILRLGGFTDVVSWKAVANELVRPRQTPDGLLEVCLAGRKEPSYVLIEVSTYPDNAVPAQLVDDVMLIYQDKRVMPDAVVFVLKEKGRVEIADHTEVSSPTGRSRFRIDWQVVRMWEQSGDDLLAVGDPGLVPWAVLGRTTRPAEAFLTECRRVVEERAPAEDVNALLTVAGVFANLRYDEKVIEAIFLARDGMIRIESPIIERWAGMAQRRAGA